MIDIPKLIDDHGYDIYFLVHDPFLALYLDQKFFFSITTYIPLASPKSPPAFSLEAVASITNIKNSAQLLAHPAIQNFILTNSQSRHRKIAVMPFKPSAKIEKICSQNSWLLLSNPASLNRLLENKISFTKLCSQNNIPQIPNKIVKLTQKSYLQCTVLFGPKLVIQTGFGWAGNSTYLATSWESISHHLPPKSVVKISPFLEGYTLINNCCLSNSVTYQSPPGLQYSGQAALSSNPFATVGRQWPSFAPSPIIVQVTAITNLVGKLLSNLNYRGYFGLDFFVSQGRVYLLECNPRLTASFAFYHQLEQSTGIIPLIYLHLLEFFKLTPSLDTAHQQSHRLHLTIQGSQLVKRSASGRIVHMLQKPHPLSQDVRCLNLNQNISDNL
ncbi:MAG: ATP-grasp domain-containing protein [Candidatus Shapirobacteria bacterium]|jgi:hypothetical protein